MGSHRRHGHGSKDDKSGIFELPVGARVARRGSTRIEPRIPTEHARPTRGHSLRDTDPSEA